MNREMELEHLRLADRHIAVGEALVEAQLARIEKMRSTQQPLEQAEALLSLLTDTLRQFHQHRSLILTALAE